MTPRLYTASFWAKTARKRYSIAISQPKYAFLTKLTALAPPKGIFNAYKGEQITWAMYAAGYQAHLNSNKQQILALVATLPNQAVLCCWEKDPAECHRSVLAGWLNDNGIPTEELK